MTNPSLNSVNARTSLADILPTVSLDAALDIVEGDLAILQQIVPGILTRALEILDKLQTAVTERNYALVELLAHRLRSGMGNIGGLAALEFARQLEDRAAAASLDDGQEILNSLAEQIEGVIVFYTNPTWPQQAIERGQRHD
jgi:HPt (histidine-containing phosphotransfer) domain-containing protein